MATSTSSSLSLSFFSSSLFSSKSHLSSKPHLKFSSSQTTLSLSINSQLTPLPILNFSGEKTGETFLNLKMAPPETARAVVHRALITHLQNKRRGTASTLTRAEVRGGGKKPYPQKKTGRARRGTQRSPLRPGGGVIFGPKPKDWSIKMNKKEKRLALSTAIASAVGNSIVVEEFGENFEAKPKTKEFIEAMKRWGLDPKEKSMFLLMEIEENVEKSGRNIGTLKMLTPRSLNLYDVLGAEKLVFTTAAVDYLNQTYGVDSLDDDDEDEDEVEEGEYDDDGGEEGNDLSILCRKWFVFVMWLRSYCCDLCIVFTYIDCVFVC